MSKTVGQELKESREKKELAKEESKRKYLFEHDGIGIKIEISHRERKHLDSFKNDSVLPYELAWMRTMTFKHWPVGSPFTGAALQGFLEGWNCATQMKSCMVIQQRSHANKIIQPKSKLILPS